MIQKDVNRFIKSFYGYGNLHSNHWFIGMEEGGGNSLEEIKSRIQVWQELGKDTVVDVVDYHNKIKNEKGENFSFLFRQEKPSNQRTWRGLIKLLLAYKAGAFSLKDVKETQTCGWGRLGADNCLLELFPLPSPSASVWKYGEWFNDDHLKSRATYKRTWESHRIEGIRSLISTERPKLVVFYGKGYCEKYRTIANARRNDLETIQITNSISVQLYQTLQTTFVFIPHPVAHGMSDEYYLSLGKTLRDKMKMGSQAL